MLSKEQILELKKQLSEQIANLPPEKKAEAQSQIDAMSPEALELMLEEQRSPQTKSPKNSKGIFRLIVSGEIPSKIVEENSVCMAVLEIKPLSKAHLIIIPKFPIKTANKIPSKAFSLAKKLAKRIEAKFKAQSVEIQTETKFGEQILNVIPQYADTPLKRYDAQEAELAEVYNKLKVEKVIRIKKKKTQATNLIPWKRRIP